MKDDIIEQLAAYLKANNVSVMFRPASADAVKQAEARLGLKIPTLLKSIYLNIGNGGFGPGYGIIGVDGGHASNLGTLADTYDQILKGAEYLGLEWRTGLLPFCEWGCNIFSCVDCIDPVHRIFRSEECVAIAQNYTLSDFFSMWFSGISILDIGRPPRKTAAITNPFTGGKTRVTGRKK